MTYSIDFRKKFLSMKEKEGLSFDQISKRFGVSKRAVFNSTKSLLDMAQCTQDLGSNPNLYQYERVERFGVSKSADTVGEFTFQYLIF